MTQRDLDSHLPLSLQASEPFFSVLMSWCVADGPLSFGGGNGAYMNVACSRHVSQGDR